jgi:putative hydrolase of the HAD superfamily
VSEIRAVLFDVDGTLVDTARAFHHALTAVAESYLPSGVDIDALAGTWREDVGGHYRAHTRGEISGREQRKRRANELHELYGGPPLDEDDAYDAWNDAFEAAFQAGWTAHDDAAACLDALDAAGIPYGALSNAPNDYQVRKLAASGLARVQMLVGVDTLGFGKPDPRVFALACELLGFDAQHVAYVGDEYDIDALAATQAGLQGIWLDRGTGPGVGHLEAGIARVTTLAHLTQSLR